MNKTLIIITGPTAIGKTSIGIRLAQALNCEIVSADSRQFYKEMSIGTAVPTAEELAAVPHHFIQHLSIFEPYSVGDYEKEALEKITELFKKNDIALLVGGSGLYVKAITQGFDAFPEVDQDVREKVRRLYETKGLEYLQGLLKDVDPVHHATMDIQNTQRVMRALEVCISSGQPFSSFMRHSEKQRPFNIIKIGIHAERPVIYDRINARVDQMIANGLIQEAKKLEPHKTLNALNTVGYKELFAYFEGKFTKEFAISEIKKNTRRFAKRQLTWFRKDKDIQWFDYQTSINKIIFYIKNSLPET